MEFVKKCVATFFGAGLSPVAPGTCGTGMACILYLLIWHLGYGHWSIFLIILLLACVGNIWIGRWAEAYFGRKDPHAVVIDEVAGYFLTIIWFQPSYLACILGFIFFRFFDITKIYPTKKCEALPHGWGILCDDLMAAVYASLMMMVSSYLVHIYFPTYAMHPTFWAW